MRKKEKKKRKIKKTRILLIIAGILLILLLAGCIVIQSIVKPPDIPESDDGPAEVAYLPPDGALEDMYIGDGLRAPEGFTAADRKEQFYTFLIIGMDEGINTDTIIVASYDGVNQVANVISIPRDSLVNVKREVKKINGAYPAGTLRGGGKEGGVTQLQREIKTIIGFVPDFYVCVDLNAFVKTIDTVGGIDVYVPLDMKYDDPRQDLHIDIKKGEQHLDGEDALKFARYRKGNGGRGTISDYQRIENQQAVIKATLSKLINPVNITKIDDYAKIFNENVYSDLKPENMLWFANQLNKIRGTDALSAYTMPTSGSSGEPMYYEYLDKAAIVDLVNETINPYTKEIKLEDVDIITGR